MSSSSICVLTSSPLTVKFRLFERGSAETTVLTSDRRRPDQTSASDVSFGRREAELTWYGGVGLGGVKHGRAQVRRGRVVHLEREDSFFIFRKMSLNRRCQGQIPLTLMIDFSSRAKT